MAIFGLGDASAKDDAAHKAKKSKKNKKNDDEPANNASQEDEAKAILEKMEAKKDADDCPFC